MQNRKVLEKMGRVSYSMCCFDIRSGRTDLRVWHLGVVGDYDFFGHLKVEWSSAGNDGEEVQSV